MTDSTDEVDWYEGPTHSCKKCRCRELDEDSRFNMCLTCRVEQLEDIIQKLTGVPKEKPCQSQQKTTLLFNKAK